MHLLVVNVSELTAGGELTHDSYMGRDILRCVHERHIHPFKSFFATLDPRHCRPKVAKRANIHHNTELLFRKWEVEPNFFHTDFIFVFLFLD